MYETTFLGQVRTYKDINEEDAYFIAGQVLKEMREEVHDNPGLFKIWGFSDLYNALISRVISTSDCVLKAHKED